MEKYVLTLLVVIGTGSMREKLQKKNAQDAIL